MYSTLKSKELFELGKKSLVRGLCSDIHKGAWQEYPVYMSYGKGSKCYDVDGNSYIDYLLAFGPMILGYAPEAVSEAVKSQIDKASLLAAPTEDMITLCNKLCEIIPSAEKVSVLLNSGSEADAHAVRLARAYTGKTKIVKFEGHYHGWMDELKVSNEAPQEFSLGPRNNPWKLRHANGQPDPVNMITVPYNDLECLEALFKRQGNEIAGVILEPIMCNAEPVFPKAGFLEGLRDLTTKYDIVLIFDEVITGFRTALGGAQDYFGVTPDLSTFAKAIAGGYPLSAVVGREDVVAAGNLSAGTFNGNSLCVAAALATIKELEKPGTYEQLERKSKKISDGLMRLGKKHGIPLLSQAAGGIWTLIFGTEEPLKDYRDHFRKVDKAMYQKVAEGCMEKGIRLNPWRGRLYMSTAHSDEDIQYTLDVFDDLFSLL